MSQTFNISVPKLKQQQLVDIASDKALNEAASYFTQHRWWWINDDEMIFDAETGNLWQGKPYGGYSHNDARAVVSALKLGGIKTWLLPSENQIKVIVDSGGFPLRQGDYRKILGWASIIINVDNHA
ncbi:MAG TPA: hypothetical protein PKC11_14390, partial [Agitococcus sp.]|nr:hypothetical protein [Agitococcus sp.]